LKDFLRNNGLLILIAAILLALITSIVSMLLGGASNPVANLIGVVATPVRDGLDGAMRWFESVHQSAFEREQQAEELAQAKQELSELRTQLREAQSALEENERLRSLLDLQPRDAKYDLVSASVTAHSASNWTSTLTLGKGSGQGIQPNCCVVDQYWNVVGTVSEVGANWCTVTTIIDTDIELGALISRTGGTAILEGDFSLMGEGKLKLSYLPENSELITNDLILTSGRGGIYPPNLAVGRIEDVRSDPSGMTRHAVIIPETELDTLSQVFVIRSFEIVE